jgi:hypothetical protein
MMNPFKKQYFYGVHWTLGKLQRDRERERYLKKEKKRKKKVLHAHPTEQYSVSTFSSHLSSRIRNRNRY